MEPGKQDVPIDRDPSQKGSRAMFSRRVLLRNLLGAAAVGMVGFPMQELLWAQGNQLTGNERGEFGRLAAGFKRSFNVPALSVAISRNGEFVFDQGFGLNQNIQTGNAKDLGPVNMSSLFRIASLTKPITAVTIFTLIEQGKVNPTDKVFGTSGILGTKYGK